MIKELKISGCYLFDISKIKDNRGTCIKHYLSSKMEILESFFSLNPRRGTLRGLHYQKLPSIRYKYIYCLQGMIYEVFVDLRKDSPTYKEYCHLRLDNTVALYLPPCIAHGFQTLVDNIIVHYLMTGKQEDNAGIRYDSLDIKWPLEIANISKKDLMLRKIK